MRRIPPILLALVLAGTTLGVFPAAGAGTATSPAPGPTIASVPPECAGTLCAGAGRADITPRVTTPMWGYGARAFYSQSGRWLEQRQRQVDTDLYAKVLWLRSEGIHTRLYARAMVLRNAAGVTMALVQTDLGGITWELHRAVADEVAPLGIERDFLLLSGTHTHGGPGAMQEPPAHGLAVADHYDPRVFARVKAGIVRAVVAAHASLAPAEAAIGQGLLTDASANRSMGAFRANPCPDPEAVEDHPCDQGSSTSLYAIDPFVTVLRVDRSDGVPLGVWTSFAAHGTILGGADMRFSGDNQGYAARFIEEEIAARAAAAGTPIPDGHTIIAAYANGTEGDISPRGSGHNRFAAAENSGRRQTRAVMEVWEDLEATLNDDLPLDARFLVLYPRGQHGTSPVSMLGAGPSCPFGRDGIPEAIPGQGTKCPFVPLNGIGPNWIPLQALRVGDVALAAFPGEMTVQMGRRVRARIEGSPFNDGQVSRAVVVGLANDYVGYTTTPEEYDVQAYEGTFTFWGREQGPWLRAMFGLLFDRLFAGEPGPRFLEPPRGGAPQAEDRSPAQALSPATSRTGPPVGTVLADPPETAERGTVAAFTWVGGQPSAEVEPDVAFVRVHRYDPAAGRWETAFTDAGIEMLIDHWKEGIEDRWAAQWEIPLDAAPGRYRFAVDGRTWVDGAPEPYAVTSGEIEVTASTGLRVTGAETAPGGVLVRAATPAPPGGDAPIDHCNAARDPGIRCPGFRWRAGAPSGGTLTATLDGIGPVTGAYNPDLGGYLLALTVSAGTGIEVAPGGLVDGAGNTNATPFSGTVA